jgi:hypothetical protein
MISFTLNDKPDSSTSVRRSAAVGSTNSLWRHLESPTERFAKVLP